MSSNHRTIWFLGNENPAGGQGPNEDDLELQLGFPDREQAGGLHGAISTNINNANASEGLELSIGYPGHAARGLHTGSSAGHTVEGSNLGQLLGNGPIYFMGFDMVIGGHAGNATEGIQTGQVPSNKEQRCPICFNGIDNALCTTCGHLFCERCITKALLIKKQCPICKTKIIKRGLRRVYI